MSEATSYSTYFSPRADISSEIPRPYPEPIITNRFLGPRLVATTVHTLSVEDAPLTKFLEGVDGVSAFSPLFRGGLPRQTTAVYLATGLHAFGSSVIEDGVPIERVPYNESCSASDAEGALQLFGWVGNLAHKLNAVQYLTGLPTSALILVARAIKRVCSDPQFQVNYRKFSKTRTASRLYKMPEEWTFDADAIRDHGFINLIYTESVRLLDEFHLKLMSTLRESAIGLIRKYPIGGLRMTEAIALTGTLSSEAGAILEFIRREPRGFHSVLHNSGVHHLYGCQAIEQLSYILFYGLGIQNIARGVNIAIRERELGTGTPSKAPIKLPAAVLLVAATILELELQTLYQMRHTFGKRLVSTATSNRLTDEEKKILEWHRHTLVEATNFIESPPSTPPNHETVENMTKEEIEHLRLVTCSHTVKEVISILDQELNIPGVLRLLATQRVRGNGPYVLTHPLVDEGG